MQNVTFEQLKMAVELAADEEVFFIRAGDGSVVLFINVNDIFYHAADAEDLPWDKVEEVYRASKEDPDWGVVKWVIKQRNQKPLPNVEKQMKSS